MLADAAGQAAVAAWAAAWRPGSMPGTSPSTSTRSTRPAAGPSPCRSRVVFRSRRRVATIGAIARSGAPVVGFGATAVMARDDDEIDPTVDAIAALAEAALG